MGHLKDSNPKPSVVGTYAHFSLPQLCLHLRALITQSSVLIKLEYTISTATQSSKLEQQLKSCCNTSLTCYG